MMPEFDLPETQQAGRLPANHPRAEVEELKADVERLLMITEALWLLLKEQHGYDDQELVRRIVQINMRDGRLNGRVETNPPPQPCPKCGRTLAKRRPRCMYCAEPIAIDPFAR